jgi:hypothetical protein
MANDDEDKPPSLRVVSDNPSAYADRQIRWAKEEAQRALSRFAAALLRTMAGSETEAHHLIEHFLQFIDAQNKFGAVSGRLLTTAELEEALHLPRAELDLSSSDDWAERLWIRERGFETIVEGALRLAAHKVLRERPHFGGKYSERAIERGIELLEELKKPRTQHREPTRLKGSSKRLSEIDLGPPPPAKATLQSSTKPSISKSRRGGRQQQGFSEDDLKELRKAIKAKDQKRITELTAKIGKPSFEGS